MMKKMMKMSPTMMRKKMNNAIPPQWEEAVAVSIAMAKYKEAQCAKCDMPIVVKGNDYLEDNSYCTTCAYDKLMMIPEGE